MISINDRSFKELKENLNEKDLEVLDLLEEEIQIWFLRKFYNTINVIGSLFTPPQQKAIPLILKDKNLLISSPTGTGKTLAAFIGIINKLLQMSKNNKLENSVYCLYISPLRALANDIKRNLEEPLDEIFKISNELGNKVGKIRHMIRHGDTSSSKKSKMIIETPHIINTTPESLSIILNSPKFREKLRTVKWVIVDEIHSLADSKRGVHLSVSLERLYELAPSFTRIGCSATIEPLDEVAKFLVGYDDSGKLRHCEIVDTRFIRKMKIKLVAPAVDLINAPDELIKTQMYKILHENIQKHNNTLIFTNTRHGAESILLNLRKMFPNYYGDHNSGCHHGSLGTEDRLFIEDKLKKGELKVVTTSTSLELGIDMPYIDLVIQISSPKSVTKLLQRIGRSGHEIGGIAKGIVLVMNRDDLTECAVMINMAKRGFLDAIHIPKNALDILIQHIWGAAINSKWKVDELKKVIKRSYCYHELKDETFEKVLDYLAANYVGMEDRKIYAKIWYDKDEKMIGRRGKLSRVIYLTNQGIIPDEFSCDVYTRSNKRFVGNLDEIYLERLKPGDIFVLGGKNYEFRYRRGGKIYVDMTNKNPTIPHWYSERLPLSFDLGVEVLKFKEKIINIIDKLSKREIINWLTTEYNCDKNSAENIYNLYYTQIHFLGKKSIPTPHRIVIEEYTDYINRQKYFLFHTCYGLKFNEGLSRALAYLISKRQIRNMMISVGDLGFSFIFNYNIKLNLKRYFDLIKQADLYDLLKDALWNSQFLKRYFRINAIRSFMILRKYKGYTKSAKKQQVSADFLINFANISGLPVLDEAYREIIEDKLEIEHLEKILSKVNDEIEIVHLVVETPTPMGIGLLNIGISDWTRSKDKNKMLKEFYRRINEYIK
ncbi:MAG: ATP-dependent helicase [Candidatus Helarchaeota archaeon]